MSKAAPAILAPLTTLPAYLIGQQQDAQKKAKGLISKEEEQADQAAADVLARKKADDARRSQLGLIAQKALISGFNKSSNFNGTLLTGAGGQKTVLGA